MSDIENILRTGKSVLDPEAAPVSEADLQAAEAALQFSLPQSYREFVSLGGLAELRIHHRVLAPAEILEALRYVDARMFVPFADNECGDLYCWKRCSNGEPEVVFADHESEQYAIDAPSFTEWLKRNRF